MFLFNIWIHNVCKSQEFPEIKHVPLSLKSLLKTDPALLCTHIQDWCVLGFFYYNETHLQYKPPKHKIKENFTALIQYKIRYKHPYIPSTSRMQEQWQ